MIKAGGVGPKLPLLHVFSPASKSILFNKPHLRAELRHRSFSCVFCRNMNSERVGRTGSIRKKIRTLRINTKRINTKPSKLPIPQQISFQYFPQRILERSSEISQTLRKFAT